MILYPLLSGAFLPYARTDKSVYLYFYFREWAADNFPKLGEGWCSLGALNCSWCADWYTDLFALWIFPPYLMRIVTRSQTWRGWWRVSRIMQQPCSNHILCGQVLPLILMPQDSRTTMTSGRKSTPSLSVTRYLEEEMMSNSQLACLESIFQSWQRAPLTDIRVPLFQNSVSCSFC